VVVDDTAAIALPFVDVLARGPRHDTYQMAPTTSNTPTAAPRIARPTHAAPHAKSPLDPLDVVDVPTDATVTVSFVEADD
jgi:hypothetical protein